MAAEEDLKKKIGALESQMAEPNFWQNKAAAQATIEEHQRLKQEAVGGGEYDDLDAVITIFSGAGGDDAEDFSRRLYEMYVKFAALHNFTVYLVHENPNDHGGYRNITFELRHANRSIGSGQGVYGILKNESGVHRLRRGSPVFAQKIRATPFSFVEE